MSSPMSAPSPSQQAALAMNSPCTFIGGQRILHEIDVKLAPARWTSIVGPNGAGKSTLLRALSGLIRTEGQVQLHGRPLDQWPTKARARAMAWLGQSESGGEDLTVHDVASLGRLPHRAWLAPPSAADKVAVEHALRATQVWSMRERRLGDLSGGERQRVLLARALAVQASVLLMDEPLAHLDPPHQADWQGLVRALVDTGGTVISVLHELSMALQADDLLIVRDGRIIHHGASGDAATHAALQVAFDNRIVIHPLAGGWVALPRSPNGDSEASRRAYKVASAARSDLTDVPSKEKHTHAD